MLKDRGSMKWTSLMLPEHVALLKQMWKENKKISQPKIDVQMAESFEFDLIVAYENKQTITVHYFVDGCIKQFIGQVTSLDPDENKVTFKLNSDQTEKTILFQQIVSIC